MLFLSLFPIPYPTNRFSALRTRLAQLLHFQSAQQALGLTSASARAAANGDAARQRLAEVPVALQLLTRFAPRNDEHTTSKQMVQRKAKKEKRKSNSIAVVIAHVINSSFSLTHITLCTTQTEPRNTRASIPCLCQGQGPMRRSTRPIHTAHG